jgi:hypothetical protein
LRTLPDLPEEDDLAPDDELLGADETEPLDREAELEFPEIDDPRAEALRDGDLSPWRYRYNLLRRVLDREEMLLSGDLFTLIPGEGG